MKNWFLALSTLAIANTTFAIATIPGSDPFTNTSGSTLGTFLNSSGDWYTESSTGTPAYITAGNYVKFLRFRYTLSNLECFSFIQPRLHSLSWSF
jgi:hypothetical protein